MNTRQQAKRNATDIQRLGEHKATKAELGYVQEQVNSLLERTSEMQGDHAALAANHTETHRRARDEGQVSNQIRAALDAKELSIDGKASNVDMNTLNERLRAEIKGLSDAGTEVLQGLRDQVVEHEGRLNARQVAVAKQARERCDYDARLLAMSERIALLETDSYVVHTPATETAVPRERPEPIVRPPIQHGKPERQKVGERAAFWEGFFVGAFAGLIVVVCAMSNGWIQ